MNGFIRFVMMLSSIFSGVAVGAQALLQTESREATRFRLEQIVNEQELMIRNQRSDRSDVLHQQTDIDGMKIYQRIPLKEDLSGLEKELRISAHRHDLALARVRVIGRSGGHETLPTEVITDHPFRLSPEQIAQTIELRIQMKGAKRQVESWIHEMNHWDQTPQIRLLQALDKRPGSRPGIWLVHLRTFRYREITFPKLRPRDPYEVLRHCSEKDSVLENLAHEAQALIPRAAPFYENRREFLLNQARLDFFIRKISRSETTISPSGIPRARSSRRREFPR